MSLTKIDAAKEAYFWWLAGQVKQDRRADQPYQELLRQMHKKEFIWIVGNDENRMIDGTDLRMEFLNIKGNRLELTREHFGPCSVLEVMLGLSRRLAFSVGGNAEAWAYKLLENLRLTDMTDPLPPRYVSSIDNVLERLIWRTYNPDGFGGFFPLNHPREDQTQIEIWYQMAAYVNELYAES
jgi:hypothetical protein